MTITPPLMLDVDGVLLDIEGTTSSISFVTEVLFPFARSHAPAYLQEHWTAPELQDALRLMAIDAKHPTTHEWFLSHSATSETQQQTVVMEEVTRLMDGDVKATGLKALQGLIWRSGFESGELQAHVYDEVPGAIRRWRQLGLDVRIYSSGSIAAQKLFFAHTIAGNLLDLFSGHYDTTMGSKKEAESYRKIAAEFGLAPERIVFVSDIAAEVEAARQAGMLAVVSLRPGNAPISDDNPSHRIANFDSLMFPRRTRDENRR